MVVAAKFACSHHDSAHDEVFEIGRAADTLFEFGKELLEVAHSQRFEYDIFSAREHSIQRGSRNARFCSDVVDAHFGDTPTLEARLGGIKNAGFGRSHKVRR